MEELENFLQNEKNFNGKSLKKAFALARNIINDNPENSIQSFSNLLFNANSNYVPSSLIIQIMKFLEEKNLLDKFKSESELKMNSTFFDSDTPNICSLINYSVISNAYFEGHEVFLLYFFIKFLCSFPDIIFDSLYTLISNFIDYIKSHPFDIPAELQQICDDAFNKRIPQTILSTYFIKMADQNVSVYKLSKAFSISLLCLQKTFSKEEILNFRTLTSKLFAVSLKPERFLLLQSYFINAIESPQLRSILVEKIFQLLNITNDQETFECIYTALLNVLQIAELDQFIPFIIRDFDTSFDETRIALMNCFDKFFQLNAKMLSDKLTPEVIKLPWYSRFKKFSFPYLVQNGNEFLFSNLIEAAQDPQMKPFISKCVTSLLGEYDKSKEPVQNAILLQESIEKAANETEVDVSKPLISLQNIFSVNPKFTEFVVSKTNSFIVRFDAAISNPKKFSSLITNDDLEKTRKSFNWDLRIRSFAAFVAGGFPRNDEDGQLFIDSIPSLLMIDSLDLQTALVRLFEDFMHLFSTKKTYSAVNKQLFIEKLNAKISPYLLPSSSSMIRQSALKMLEAVWKRFPEISPFDRKNLISILKDGTVSLKKLAYSVSKYLKEPLISDEKVTIDKLPFDPSKKDALINVDSLQQFAILLEQDEVVLNLTESDIIQLIQFQFSASNLEEKDRDNDWEILSEIFHIICLLCLKLKVQQETFEKATDHIFNSLIETRKSGLVMKCYPYLAELIKCLKSSSKLKEYCDRLTKVLASFDMAQMRRSAGLPFISVSLIKGNSELFDDLSSALVAVCLKSENGNEVANALNTLNLIVKENSFPENFFGVMFSTILKSCMRFPNEWDVLSAVDLSYNTLLHKIWTFYVKETTFRGLSRTLFLSKIDGSRNALIEALESNCSHCIYIGLLLFTLFPRDAGDSTFVPHIIRHKSSRSSRIRRTAVRALINVLSIGKETEFVIKIDPQNLNEVHFLTMFKHEVAVLNNSENLYPYENVNNNLKTIYPLLFEPNFDSNKVGSICLVLKNWNEKSAPEKVQRKLIDDLIVNNANNVNLTYLTEGLKFLIRTLPLNFIDHSILPSILRLFKSTPEMQIEIKSLYLQLIKFVVEPSIDEILDEIVEISCNPLQIALHHGISFIADLIVPKSKVATIFLLMNDIPLIRKRAAVAFSQSIGSNESVLNETEAIKELIGSLHDNEKQFILKMFIRNINNKLESDEFGEPTYFLVDEFFILFECFPNTKNDFFAKMKEPLALNEMRKIILEVATPLLK